MSAEIIVTDYIYNNGISKLENDWLQVIPERYRGSAFICLKEFTRTVSFNNNIEKSKASLAYMDAFVTAITMAQEEKGQQDGQDDTKKEDEDKEYKAISQETQED